MISDFLNPKERKGAFYRNDQQQPNIVFITVDMISADCYHPQRPLSGVINTPNIESIATEGTSFSSAFTPSPLCGPASTAIFTGMHPPYLSNGERTPVGMKVDLELDDIIFQDYLKRVGYSLKHSGKCHVGVEKFVRTFGENVHAWDRWGPPVEDDDRYLAYLANMECTVTKIPQRTPWFTD
ncbi:sulfatase-like hydrolase/transferase [Vibrio harveyi]|nr:sulfatase-like hydrolase/transferase [Vibrio harveyi]